MYHPCSHLVEQRVQIYLKSVKRISGRRRGLRYSNPLSQIVGMVLTSIHEFQPIRGSQGVPNAAGRLTVGLMSCRRRIKYNCCSEVDRLFELYVRIVDVLGKVLLMDRSVIQTLSGSTHRGLPSKVLEPRLSTYLNSAKYVLCGRSV